MEVGSLLIVGIVVSVIVQLLKSNFGTKSNTTLAIVLGLSVLAGTVYYFLKDTPLWEAIVSILGFAGAVYVYIIKRFE